MRRVAWSDEVAAGLAIAAGDDLPDIAADVIEGRAAVFDMDGDGLAVLRIDDALNYRECVFVAGQGRNLRKHIKTLERAAKGWCATKVRTHVEREGLVRMYQREGYELSQYVLTKEI